MFEVEPLFLLSSLPFLATSFEDAQCLYGAARPRYAAALARHRLRLLFASPWPPTGLWSKQPVAAPDDLTGLAVRTYDATSAEVFKALGADAVSLSFTEVMPRLANGSVQAVLSSGDGGAGRRLWEHLPAFTAVAYAIPLSFAIVNEENFAALAPDLQQAVTAAAGATEAAQWQLVRQRLAANYAQMKTNGVTITNDVAPALRQRMAQAARNAIGAWMSRIGPDAAAILTACRLLP